MENMKEKNKRMAYFIIYILYVIGNILYKLVRIEDRYEADEDGEETLVSYGGYTIRTRWYMWLVLMPLILPLWVIVYTIGNIGKAIMAYFTKAFTYQHYATVVSKQSSPKGKRAIIFTKLLFFENN